MKKLLFLLLLPVLAHAQDVTVSSDIDSFLQATNDSDARSRLGVAIGTDVQAFDALLADIAALTDPDADRILFWDDTAGELVWLTIGDNLTITGTTIDASGGGGSGTGDLNEEDIDTLAELNAIITDATLLSETAINAKFNDTILTGEPTAPTPVTGSNGTEIATAALVDAKIAAIESINLTYSSSTTAGQPLDADNSLSGPVLGGRNAGATIAKWQAVRWDFASGEYLLTDADVLATADAVGLATAASTDGNPLTIIANGYVRNDAWNWSAGPLYVSGTAGGLTQTAVSTSGGGHKRVGYAVTADIIYVDFGASLYEIE